MSSPLILSASPAERLRLARLAALLGAERRPVRLHVGPSAAGASDVLPGMLVPVLLQLFRELASGRSVALQPLGRMLTIGQAARILKVCPADMEQLASARWVPRISTAGKTRVPVSIVVDLLRSRAEQADGARHRALLEYTARAPLEL